MWVHKKASSFRSHLAKTEQLHKLRPTTRWNGIIIHSMPPHKVCCATTRSPQLRFKGYLLDPVTEVVQYGDLIVRLSPRYIGQPGSRKLVTWQWVTMTNVQRELCLVPVLFNTFYKRHVNISHVLIVQDCTAFTPVYPSRDPCTKWSVWLTPFFAA